MGQPDGQPRLIGGRYRLEQPIGRGGMGTVWRGRDELLGRAVAVKEVRFPQDVGAREQSELRERTLREARATARLSHPNVVTTYDVVEEDGRPWIVMELLEARSLSEILRADGALPPDRVAQIGLELLDALEVSHNQGVVHRDVKPGNVLVTSKGRTVLTDFGIATMSGDPSVTSTGVVLGSPAYMSPERARGQRPGPEADLWSLGATLYAAVEGRPPFEGDNALGTLTAVISDPLDPPVVGGALGDAILRLLEKDPAARPSIEQTRVLLRKAAADKPSATVTLPVAAVGALARGGHTQALPAEPLAGAAGAARSDPVQPDRSVAPSRAPNPPERSLWQDHNGDLPPSGRPSLMGVLVGLAALLLLGGLAFLLLRDDGASAEKTASTPPASPTREVPKPTESPGPTPTPSSAAPSTPSPPATTAAAKRDVPAGYRLHRDESGFSVAVPQGWQRVRRNATAVDFREPGGSRYLRVDQTDDPKDDPVADWTRQEKRVSQRLGGYERIRIDPVDYRDYKAADWEFTYGNTHVLNRGMNTGDKGYALYWSTPQSQWEESRPMFNVFTRTFRPEGDDD